MTWPRIDPGSPAPKFDRSEVDVQVCVIEESASDPMLIYMYSALNLTVNLEKSYII